MESSIQYSFCCFYWLESHSSLLFSRAARSLVATLQPQREPYAEIRTQLELRFKCLSFIHLAVVHARIMNFIIIFCIRWKKRAIALHLNKNPRQVLILPF